MTIWGLIIDYICFALVIAMYKLTTDDDYEEASHPPEKSEN